MSKPEFPTVCCFAISKHLRSFIFLTEHCLEKEPYSLLSFAMNASWKVNMKQKDKV